MDEVRSSIRADVEVINVRRLGGSKTIQVIFAVNKLHITNLILRMRPRRPGRIVICVDFNEHHCFWGRLIDSPREGEVAGLYIDNNLVIINNKIPTLFGGGTTLSVLHLTLSSKDVKLSWVAEPDTWGSVHLPIRHIPHLPVWRILRSDLVEATPAKSIDVITSVLQRATKVITLLSCVQVPGLQYLKLRTARKRAERYAHISGKPVGRTSYEKVSAMLRRHTNSL